MAGNMFEMMKKAAAMQKQMKRIQKELAGKTVEASSGCVKVVATGDMSLRSVTIDAEAMAALRPGALERNIVSAVNSALNAAKKQAGSEMARMSGGLGGLSELLGG